MPNWNEVLREIQDRNAELQYKQIQGSPLDDVRRKYLQKLSDHTGRNTIAYYSGWLDRPDHPGVSINDSDKNALMSAIHQMPREHGLDLILHTPGGETAATESLVHYLREMFGQDMRALVPQIAMSGGTMIACACKSIVMGKQSNLGPIDPQLRGIPAKEVVAEFERAVEDAEKNPASIPIWQSIIGNYHPSFLEMCEQAIEYSEKITKAWLRTGMFAGESEATPKARRAVEALADTKSTHTHARHLHIDDAERFGLNVVALEDDPELQDLLLTVHHAYMHTFAMSTAIKIIENHRGIGVIRTES